MNAPVPPAGVVRRLLDAMQARDWEVARRQVADDAVIVYPVTGERFNGRRWMDMNEAYPEGWAIDVAEIIEQDHRVAARVRVTLGEEIAWCAGFYSVEGDRITDGVEFWTTELGDPAPAWRRPFWD